MSDLIFADSLSRLGTESAFVVLARAQKLASEGRDIINLGIGQPDFKTPGHMSRRHQGAVRLQNTNIHPANGIAPLRRHLQKACPDFTVATVPKQADNVVVCLAGNHEYFAIMMFGKRGVEIVPNPGFPSTR